MMSIVEIYNNITPEQWEILKSAGIILGGIVVAVVIYLMNG